MLEKITEPRVIKIFIFISLFTFIPGIALAITISLVFGGTVINPGEYNFIDNFISDLGSFRYTPAPFILDTISMVTGTLFVPIAIFSNRLALKFLMDQDKTTSQLGHGRRACYIGFIALLFGAAGLFGIGLFSEDRDYGLHRIFSAIVFAGFAIGSTMYGFASIFHKSYIPRSLAFFMATMPASAITLFAVNVSFNQPPFPEALLEWFMLATIFWWTVPSGIKEIKLINKRLDL
ncbi:MAG: DUF998 domain-containing protein [Promethearchaeota archaeon]